MVIKSLREDVFEDDNMELIGHIPTETGMLEVFYNPNWEVQGPRYFSIATVDEDGYITETSKFCRILADKPEYLTGVDKNDSLLTKKEKELLIDFFKNKSVQWPNEMVTGWENYIYLRNMDKKCGCFSEISEDERYIEDTIETLPIPDYSLLETED